LISGHYRNESQGGQYMTSKNENNIIIFENPSTEKKKIMPDVSFLDFLDGLSGDTLKLVALIMSESTGQKNMLHQLKLNELI